MDKLSTTEFQLLAVIGARDMAGREIAAAFEREEGRSISFGTLYTVLGRLKEAGYLASRDDTDADGRVRFFKITGQGSAALNSSRKEYARLSAFGVKGAIR